MVEGFINKRQNYRTGGTKVKESFLEFLCGQFLFPGKYIVNEAFTLHKIKINSMGFLNQNVVKTKICNVPQ